MFLPLRYPGFKKLSTALTCKLKWVNELQHEILSQRIIRFTLGITLVNNNLKKMKITFCENERSDRHRLHIFEFSPKIVKKNYEI